jgi:hypothetical protein
VGRVLRGFAHPYSTLINWYASSFASMAEFPTIIYSWEFCNAEEANKTKQLQAIEQVNTL